MRCFQSHYGLILSQNSRFRRTAMDSLSIPLWSDFIEAAIPFIIPFSLAFNPTMVWFYLVEARIKLLDVNGNFQSHYGLILSKRAILILCYYAVTFNPTMVWFYPALAATSGYARAVYFFQSHYGLILSPKVYFKTDEGWVTFNPTMVWFYREF